MLLGLCCPPISKQLLCHLTSGGLAADNLAETEPFLPSPTAFMADTKLLIKKSSWRGEYQGNGLESHLEFVEQIAIFIHPKQALIE